MIDLVERLRERPSRYASETEEQAKERRQREREEAADRIEKLEAALRGAYEVYAGSEGFIPETCAEGYQRQIIRQMVDCISAALEERA